MRVLYFAWIRQHVGISEETVDPPASVRSVDDLIAWLRLRSSGHARAFADSTSVHAAVDQRHVQLDDELGQATEVAFFPPVTGG